MKKVTFLTCVLALCTSTMFAQTLEVTTADMDPVAAGGLVYVTQSLQSILIRYVCLHCIRNLI